MMFALVGAAAALSCKDLSGAGVDWFIGLRKPFNGKIVAMYPPSKSFGSVLEDTKLAGHHNGIGQTLLPLYSSDFLSAVTAAAAAGTPADAFFALYNDQPPDGSNQLKNGHTKGVIAGDKEGVFWLVHSQPKWPPETKSPYVYNYDLMNGQSFFCVSLPPSALPSLLAAFALNNPFVYDGALPPLDGTTPLAGPTHHQPLATVGGLPLVQFAKTSAWAKAIDTALISPTLGVPMLWQTWLNSPGPDGPKCGRVGGCEVSEYDVTTTRWPTGDEWQTLHDHSKWGVSPPGEAPWVCIGDINREHGQWRRGGGFLCTPDGAIAAAFRAAVAATNTSCTPCVASNVAAVAPVAQEAVIPALGTSAPPSAGGSPPTGTAPALAPMAAEVPATLPEGAPPEAAPVAPPHAAPHAPPHLAPHLAPHPAPHHRAPRHPPPHLAPHTPPHFVSADLSAPPEYLLPPEGGAAAADVSGGGGGGGGGVGGSGIAGIVVAVVGGVVLVALSAAFVVVKLRRGPNISAFDRKPALRQELVPKDAAHCADAADAPAMPQGPSGEAGGKEEALFPMAA